MPDKIKFFDVHRIGTVLETDYKDPLLPVKGEEVHFRSLPYPEEGDIVGEALNITSNIDAYKVLRIYREIFEDDTVVVHVDVKNIRDIEDYFGRK